MTVANAKRRRGVKRQGGAVGADAVDMDTSYINSIGR